jgi:hypothetical protein
MKKVLFLVFIFFSNHFCLAQDVLMQVAKFYFRSNPFDKEFSQFLSHIMNDPTLINSTISKRTDTTFFYLRGDYTHHNPFFFKAKRTSVIVGEKELVLNDSLELLDTIITYQVAGYTDGGKEGEQDVKEEFERFDKKYLKKFIKNDFIELKVGSNVNGAIRNYFVRYSFLAPLSVAWQKIVASNENVFVITLRFKVSSNVATLPVTPDSP